MRIGLLGNMNNNFFALMRYFRDLGADAHLMLYDNDGVGNLAHFRPEDDTWHLARWQPYIHQTGLQNGPLGGAALPWAVAQYLKTLLRGGVPGAQRWPRLALANPVRRALAPYEVLLGTGVAPALAARGGRALDGFFPYACGIEFVASPEDHPRLTRGGWLRRSIYRSTAHAQIAGLRRTRVCFNADMGLTATTFESLGIPFRALALPMVYNREAVNLSRASEPLHHALDKMGQAGFRIVAHARHHWRQPATHAAKDWHQENKHNDWLIRAFAQLVQLRPTREPLLVLLEYGKDVEASRALCQDLGIADRVLWMPKRPRREIMVLLEACDLGVGEFLLPPGTLWGGTGWEVLAAGRPLMHGFPFGEGAFERALGHPPPPLLAVQREEDVLAGLLAAADDPGAMARIGRDSGAWFERHNGIGLARHWLEALHPPQATRPGARTS
ncbi:MAG: hypothetical protein VKS61_02820 [Candidatus Sericytochromatia bacterium]|nr:hypothetical protein [Candidatus Sericytochromatia bacterium]